MGRERDYCRDRGGAASRKFRVLPQELVFQQLRAILQSQKFITLENFGDPARSSQGKIKIPVLYLRAIGYNPQAPLTSFIFSARRFSPV
jgi:hypothetical protein